MDLGRHHPPLPGVIFAGSIGGAQEDGVPMSFVVPAPEGRGGECVAVPNEPVALGMLPKTYCPKPPLAIFSLKSLCASGGTLVPNQTPQGICT